MHVYTHTKPGLNKTTTPSFNSYLKSQCLAHGRLQPALPRRVLGSYYFPGSLGRWWALSGRWGSHAHAAAVPGLAHLCNSLSLIKVISFLFLLIWIPHTWALVRHPLLLIKPLQLSVHQATEKSPKKDRLIWLRQHVKLVKFKETIDKIKGKLQPRENICH